MGVVSVVVFWAGERGTKDWGVETGAIGLAEMNEEKWNKPIGRMT